MKQGLIFQIRISIELTVLNPKKTNKQAFIVKLTTFRHRTLLFTARRKLKNGVKLHFDLSRKRLKLLLDAQRFIENIGVSWLERFNLLMLTWPVIWKLNSAIMRKAFSHQCKSLKIYWRSRSLFLLTGYIYYIYVFSNNSGRMSVVLAFSSVSVLLLLLLSS